ncbi:methyltransferase [Streptomyces sp. NPDC006602]|uniref:methyltransferase n=1 Tax=Streptomyces sp. NPDC006602 TaxID=3364751 RepID=UPI0036998205
MTANPSQTRAPGPGGPPAGSENLLRILTSPWVAQAVYTVARFDLADRLANGPQTSDELAEATGLDPDALYRIMRTLSSFGVFRGLGDRRFALDEAGHLLRDGVPGTQKYSALLFGEETFRSWGEVAHSVRTGRPAFDEIYGKTFYDYLSSHPAGSENFNRVMGGAAVVPPIAESFDFGPYKHVVDVGGGTGALLASVLSRHPQLSGTLFDLPEAIAQAERELDGPVRARSSLVAGSFLDSAPVGGDVYLLSRVLHNWADADATAILRNVRAAMSPGGRLLIFERFLPDDDTPHMGKIFDLVMLVVLGGRERSSHEYAALLAETGFRPVREIEGPRNMGLLEAEAI